MANNETMNPDLLLKYLDNEASDQEMREVLAWLEADPANRLELDRLDRAIAASIIHGPLPGEQSAATPAPAPEKAGRRITLRRIVRYTAELAAVLLVGVVLSWTLTRNRLDEWSQRTTSIEVPPGHTSACASKTGRTYGSAPARGSNTRLSSPDGSVA